MKEGRWNGGRRQEVAGKHSLAGESLAGPLDEATLLLYYNYVIGKLAFSGGVFPIFPIQLSPGVRDDLVAGPIKFPKAVDK
jgi:hypothetical protein